MCDSKLWDYAIEILIKIVADLWISLETTKNKMRNELHAVIKLKEVLCKPYSSRIISNSQQYRAKN